MGCVNETEDFQLHSLGALVYFVGYDAYMVGRTARLLRINAATRACTHPISLGVQAACAATSVLTTIARYAPRLCLASGLTATTAATASGLTATATAAATTATASGLATLDPLTRVLDPVWP